MKLFYEIDGVSWKIARAPSIYTNRAGMDDVVIEISGDWGGREANGKLYNTVWKCCAENGEPIRSHSSYPDEFNHDFLMKMGFINNHSTQ